MSGTWQNGLFGCFGDCGLCVITYFLPCVTAGRNAEAMGKSCIVHGLLFFVPVANWLCPATVRGEIRESKGIEGSAMGDICVMCFCPCCALVQSARELKGEPGSGSMVRQ